MKCQPQRKFVYISFTQMPKDVGGFWEVLSECLKEQEALPQMFRLSQIAGHAASQQSEEDFRATPAEIPDTIAKRGLTGFSVNTGYDPTSVSYRLHQFSFHCGIDDSDNALNSWRNFIERIGSRFPTIGSWMPFWLYHGWQNLQSPIDYSRGTYGQLPPGFKQEHEPDKYGIGPGQTLFKDPMNPGRAKVVDHRCIFYPTAEIWLGPHFWPYAKCSKEEALAADFWLETRDTRHYTYFKCWPTPFTRPDGEQGRMQQRLWKLFFQEDCEWPPGSTTISDEPMYGPRELWPEGLDYPYRQ
jgi:hypothetical protein